MKRTTGTIAAFGGGYRNGSTRACAVFAAFLMVLLTALLLGCGGSVEDRDGSDSAASPGAPVETTNASEVTREEKRSSGRSSRRAGVSVKVMRSRYGRILFDGAGRALYLFTRDRTGRSRCYGGCARAWPPFLTSGEPQAGGGARSSLLGTTRRRDGRTQVTYRGHPLYYYVGDRRAGQVLCQDVVEFGGTWLVLTSGGRAVR